jgi:RNA polymerase sigma-70 factor (ECF subfamily)
MNANWNEFRPRMMSVAYRLLGSVADAEDAVQEAFLRLQDAEDVSSPEGFLIKTTTQRCIDQLRAAKHRKAYVGPWVPEPVDTKSGASNSALAESLTQAFLMMLERLSPTERAAFVLRNVFDYEYLEIAEVLGKSETAVRQIVSRAKLRLHEDRPRFKAAPREADELAERFVAACRAGDVQRIEEMFADNAEVYSDGGGKVTAARVVVRGPKRAARFLAGVFGKKHRDRELRLATVNRAPGFVITSEGNVVQVVSLRIENGVRAVYMTNNPDKLARWSVAEIE